MSEGDSSGVGQELGFFESEVVESGGGEGALEELCGGEVPDEPVVEELPFSLEVLELDVFVLEGGGIQGAFHGEGGGHALVELSMQGEICLWGECEVLEFSGVVEEEACQQG